MSDKYNLSIDANFREIGKALARGIADEVIKFVLIFIAVSALLSVLKPTDDSDLSHFKRSGMKTFTDHKTGKEYLASPYGGLIERAQ